MANLSDTQRVILSRAAQHDALLGAPPTAFPRPLGIASCVA